MDADRRQPRLRASRCLQASATKTPAHAASHFLNFKHLLPQDLSDLLAQPDAAFCAAMQNDASLRKCLDSYLQNAR